MADGTTDDVVERSLDELYTARPADFTALRTRLAGEAKRNGDVAAAKRITGSRKPTTAAWVVNVLAVLTSARDQLAELGGRLRDAHAAMDGAEIRSLTTEQRRLVDELARQAFRLAGLDAPAPALRDDVTATLQAAVADPEVSARLGRLAKAEQWSGFAEFGSVTAVSATKKKPTAPSSARPDTKPASADKNRARAILLAAQRAKADADAALAEVQSDLATARLRRQDAERRLHEAEDALSAAQDAYDAAKQASVGAADAVKTAQAEYRRANG
ncbi:hypothetical protein [Mycobacterium sp. SMC-4]|uniref:hypothetical protein n=1 Tax=Mycobacterium sp. SMC-4 TaxID=2857059 RepID=UPI0021B42FF3|nr:hypothetical protein [Mycobacterium sp. SMC-4]UXA17952.1 hypothetical protein KXD98_25280 [Mycobacterium sp. SMC-4]